MRLNFFLRIFSNARSNFPPTIPCFRCFWLGLAKQFSKMCMPNIDTFMVLEDEMDKNTKRSILQKGVDLVVAGKGLPLRMTYSMVMFWFFSWSGPPSLRKILMIFYKGSMPILWACVQRLDDIDGALDLLDLEAGSDFVVLGNSSTDTDVYRGDEHEHLVSHPPNVAGKDNNRQCLENESDGDNSSSKCLENESDGENAGSERLENESDGDNAGSEMSCDVIQLAESSVEFKDINSIYNVTITVNGLVRNSMFPRHVRCKYHELCCSQVLFLH